MLLGAGTIASIRVSTERIGPPVADASAIAAPLSAFELQPRARKPHAFFLDENFSNAPTQWRTAGFAVAGVTNRWQCDPRWSFYTLYNDRKLGKPAALWSKRSFTGDVSVEFFVGVAMNSSYGIPYRYARDINVTIASNGNDLTKGYTFCFGGKNNTCSCIMRNGTIVKEIPVTIPVVMDYHLHWFHVVAERSGGTLSFRVDRFFDTSDHEKSMLEYDDPQPLTGNRIAIWTYDCPLSISRITLSGETNGWIEAPDFVPGQLVTMYDQK